jgi:hypothetical protein
MLCACVCRVCIEGVREVCGVHVGEHCGQGFLKDLRHACGCRGHI